MTNFFVGGSQRAGTTLLQSVLCADTTTNSVIREASPLRAMVAAYQYTHASMTSDAADYFASDAELRRFYGEWVEAFLDNTRRRQAPAKHLVLKEPHLTTLFPELNQLVADAKFLIIVRDPRDTIASMIDVGARMSAQGHENPFPGRDVRKLANHYKSFYAPCLSSASDDFHRKTCYVRYERLVCETETEVEKIRAFTGLRLEDFDPDTGWSQATGDPSGLLNYYKGWATNLLGRGFSPQSIGQYRDKLSCEEVALIEQACADAFKIFDYETDYGPKAPAAEPFADRPAL